MKELFELKLGNMTMEEYEGIFLELMRYVDFIKDENVNIYRLLSGYHHFTGKKFNLMSLRI
jgi:hypothetical protein